MLTGTIGPEWVGVIGALGGVLVTGIVGIATAILNHRLQRASNREDRAHQAQEANLTLRREAYAHYLTALEAIDNFLVTRPPRSTSDWKEQLRTTHKENPAVFDAYYAALAGAQLVAGDRVAHALDRYKGEWDKTLASILTSSDPLEVEVDTETEVKEEMLTAMRAEQGAPTDARTARRGGLKPSRFGWLRSRPAD
jgi:hypothetical protein